MPCLHTLSRPPARTSAPEVASRPRRSEDEALGELYQQVSSRSGLAPPPEAFDALAAYPSRPLWPCAAACGPPLGFPFPLGLSSACTPSQAYSFSGPSLLLSPYIISRLLPLLRHQAERTFTRTQSRQEATLADPRD